MFLFDCVLFVILLDVVGWGRGVIGVDVVGVVEVDVYGDFFFILVFSCWGGLCWRGGVWVV